MKMECSRCDGYGFIPTVTEKGSEPLCPDCGGTGRQDHATIHSAQSLSPEAEAAKSSSIPQGQPIGVCSLCLRMITSQPCPHCYSGQSTPAPDTITLPEGGRHSRSPYRAELLPPRALLCAATILATGAEKYGIDNWRRIPAAVHIGRAQAHLLLYLSGDTSEDHLGNALCRTLFALELSLSKKEGFDG